MSRRTKQPILEGKYIYLVKKPKHDHTCCCNAICVLSLSNRMAYNTFSIRFFKCLLLHCETFSYVSICTNYTKPCRVQFMLLKYSKHWFFEAIISYQITSVGFFSVCGQITCPYVKDHIVLLNVCGHLDLPICLQSCWPFYLSMVLLTMLIFLSVYVHVDHFYLLICPWPGWPCWSSYLSVTHLTSEQCSSGTNVEISTVSVDPPP